METKFRSAKQGRITLKVEAQRTHAVYSRLRDMIIGKEFPVGAKLKQAEIARRLSASRTPVVNALHKLESEGLVDSAPHKGFFVHRVSVKELYDLFSIRKALDAVVITDLVYSLRDGQIEELFSLFEPFREQGVIDAAAYRMADIAFHSYLIDNCTNGLAKRINQAFNILNRSYMAGLIRSPHETLAEHLEIINAIRKRDLPRAKLAMASHIEKTLQMLQTTVMNLQAIGVNPESIPVDELRELQADSEK